MTLLCLTFCSASTKNSIICTDKVYILHTNDHNKALTTHSVNELFSTVYQHHGQYSAANIAVGKSGLHPMGWKRHLKHGNITEFDSVLEGDIFTAISKH